MFIFAFLAVGCSSGGGGDSFVASPGGGVPAGGGGGGATAGAGSVTFNFVRAQSPIVVPTTTVQLRFEFFTGLQGTGTIIKRELRDYADTITIENVPTSVQSTVVTAITADGFPIAEFTANVIVPANGNVTVDSTDGTLTPVTAVAIVSSPQSVALGNADSFQLNIQVEFSNGEVVPVDLTSGIVTFSSSQPSVATVDANGNITAGLDGTAFITATLNAPGFASVSVDIPLGVGDGVQPPPTITGIQIVTPAAAAISLPQGTMSVPLVVQATFSNGNTSVVNAANGVQFESNRSEVVVDGNQAIVVSNNAPIGQVARITVSFQGNTDFIDVTVSAATLQSITATPSVVNLPYGGFTQTITVTGTFSDGSQATVTPASLNFAGPMTRYTLDTSTGAIVITTNAVSNPPTGAGDETLTITHMTQPVPAATVTVTVGTVTVTSLTVTPSPLTDSGAVNNALVPGEIVEFTVLAEFSDGRAAVDVGTYETLQVDDIQDPTTAGTDNIAAEAANPPNTTRAQVVAIAPTGSQFAQVVFTLLGAGSGGADVTASVNVEVQSEVIDLAAGLTYNFAGINIVDFPTSGVPDPNVNAVNLPRGYVGVVEVEATFNSGVTRRLRPGEYTLLLGDPGDFLGGDAVRLWQTDDGVQPADYYYDSPPANDTDTNGIFTDGIANQPALGRFDDLYFQPRTVEPVTAALQGSFASGSVDGGGTVGQAVTRRTFRAVAADWRRDAFQTGAGGGGNAVANDNSLIAPGGARRVTVRLDDSVLPATTMDPAEEDFEFTVTVTDPPSVEINTDAQVTNFVNYQGDGRIPVNAVRELEVRVEFDEVTAATSAVPDDGTNIPTTGPFVDALPNFKLAEANCLVTSASGGVAQFATTAPTEIGFLGIFSADNTVGNNIINVKAVPIHGDNFRPVFIGPTDEDYNYVDNIYGTTSGDGEVQGFDFVEFQPGGRDATAEPDSDPVDGGARIVEPLSDIPVQFLRPFLFSVDPPTPSNPIVPIPLELGVSRVYRTVVQYASGIAPVDVSLDYPPVLFVDEMDPAFIARLANPAEGGTAGNIFVSGINPMGGTVEEADIIAASGGDTALAEAVTALNGGNPSYGVQGLVVAIGAAGFPIPFRGQFGAPGVPANQPDSQGNASQSGALSGVDIAP